MVIVLIEEEEVFMHYSYYHEQCFPQWMEGDVRKVEAEERHKCCGCYEWIEAKRHRASERTTQ